MGKAITEASWIGKAAYEIIQIQGWNGRQANATARDLADGLLDYGIDIGRIDPRDYARQHFGAGRGTAALDATLGEGKAVATRIHVSHYDDDGLELHVDGANGLFGDRSISWDFANGIVEAHNGRHWDNGRGYTVRPVHGHIVVTMPATVVRHAVTFVLTRAQVVAFGNACLKAATDKTGVDVGNVDARWGVGPTSPVVRARIAERLRMAA
ncbi:hypothetical protein ASE86_06290 [Sphingomonas sp. Leaf33]|uniref:hypothetical protein n=1 Tax=Sphingomonas sp. Leaf33 TaxID=1736215 RepID=UPI0006FC9979|nr:hypothetical protein [Sphingomonas sp. Leaf33]KQN25808.1 hypothetical protein ASE86_06290 [Sphingomonas sp. Leaf33]